jgi:integrase
VWVQVLENAEIEDLQIRDLRRTFSTYAGEAGVPWEVVAKLLAHAIPGATEIYDKVTPKRKMAGVNRAVDYILQMAGRNVGEVVDFPNERSG